MQMATMLEVYLFLFSPSSGGGGVKRMPSSASFSLGASTSPDVGSTQISALFSNYCTSGLIQGLSFTVKNPGVLG